MPLALQFHHHHFRVHPHGPPIGFLGIAIAAFASWAGVPGAGEAALITGAAFASRGKLDIATVELAAFIGATIGGTFGWLVGMRVGADMAARPGPLYRWRLRALRSGERFYNRWGVVAVFLTPSWIAGVNRMKPLRFLAANAVSAAVWALGIGLATYFAGPSLAEIVGDIGLLGGILLAVVAVGVVVVRWLRRR